jgi:DNA polymerase III sliding clamp (beta) subunit (PCNA family)
MKIKRRVLLHCLEKCMHVISSKSAEDLQSFNFHDGRLQATNGSIWIDTVLPEGLDLEIKVKAKHLYELVKKLTAKELELRVDNSNLIVVAGKSEAEFKVEPPTPDKIPELGDNLVKILDDFIDGLRFCGLGASKDETSGPLSGVHITDDNLWSADRYRILNWKLESSMGIDAIAPPKFGQILHSFKGDLEKLTFSPNNTGGLFGVSLKDGTYIFAACINGEYKDLSSFFPQEAGAETIILKEEFIPILDRHVTFLNDVKAVEKEVKFTVRTDGAETLSTKFVSGGEVERRLLEVVALGSERTGKEFSFAVNPVLLKDVVDKCLEFQYHSTDSSVVLFQSEKFRYLIRARD